VTYKVKFDKLTQPVETAISKWVPGDLNIVVEKASFILCDPIGVNIVKQWFGMDALRNPTDLSNKLKTMTGYLKNICEEITYEGGGAT
jgi:hypothetical protein